MNDLEQIKNYMDEKGRIKTWPAKYNKKILVLKYLGTKFEDGKDYSEKEVNEILEQWHCFNDYFILRRGLVDLKILNRKSDGSKYWKSTQETPDFKQE